MWTEIFPRKKLYKFKTCFIWKMRESVFWKIQESLILKNLFLKTYLVYFILSFTGNISLKGMSIFLRNFSHFWSTEVSQFWLIFFSRMREWKHPNIRGHLMFDRELASFSVLASVMASRLGFLVRRELIAAMHDRHRLYELKWVVKSSSRYLVLSWVSRYLVTRVLNSLWFQASRKCLTNKNVETRLRLSLRYRIHRASGVIFLANGFT